ncbi:MAG: GntR family transcriptional regulator [Thermoanaerobaculia bacterium]
MFEVNASAAAPIWRQIEEGIRRMIVLGSLEPGGSVPSVRDLARELRVNPNTVARAYQRLIDAGVLAVKRGEGTYVADTPSHPKKAERNESLRNAAAHFAGTALSIGASVDEALSEVEAAYQRVVKEHRRSS